MRTSKTADTMRKRIRSTWAVLERFHTSTSWITPTPTAATKATVRLTMAPTMAAVSASSSSSGLSTWVSDDVWPGAARMAVKADRSAGEHPCHVRGPPDPHPRQPGGVAVLGRGPHGEAPWRPPDEGHQGERDQRGDDERQDLARGEEVGADGEAQVERDGKGAEEVASGG